MDDNSTYFKRDYETNNGKLLRINQIEFGDVGCVVWDASIVLGKYIENLIKKREGLFEKNRKIIELGAGTGLVGLVLASYGFSVTLTDLDEIVGLLKVNKKENESVMPENCVVECKVLDWSSNSDYIESEFGKQDVILIADCVYYEKSVDSLVNCLRCLSRKETVIYCCYEERDVGKVPKIQNDFIKLINEYFHVESVEKCDLDDLYQSDDIKVLKFTLK